MEGQPGTCETLSKILPCVPLIKSARWAICAVIIGITVITCGIALFKGLAGTQVEADEPSVGPAGRGGAGGPNGNGGPGGNSNHNFDTTSTNQIFDILFKLHIGSISTTITVAAAVAGVALAIVLLVGSCNTAWCVRQG